MRPLCLPITGLFFAATIFVSCNYQTSMDSSDLSIFGGRSTDGFPAVVKLIRHDNKKTCTGSFISSSHLLTSAHCIADINNGGLTIAETGERSEGVVGYNLAEGLWPPSSIADGEKFGSPLDLAVVMFPENQARATLTFGRARPGERVTMVGFGYTQGYEDDQSGGEKYLGTNFLTSVTDYLLKIESSLDQSSGLAIVTPGDSGGPLLNDAGQIIGVTSGSRIVEQDSNGKVLKVEARFVKLASATSERLVKQAQSAEPKHLAATLPESPGGVEVFLCGGSGGGGGFDRDLFDRFGSGRNGGGFFDDCDDDRFGGRKFRLTADYGGASNRFGRFFGGGIFNDFFNDDCFDGLGSGSNNNNNDNDNEDNDRSGNQTEEDHEENERGQDSGKGSGSSLTAAQVISSIKCSNAGCHGSALPAVSSEQAAINRVNDANSPMPPANSPALTTEEKAAFKTYILTEAMLAGFATYNPFTGTVYNTLGAPLSGLKFDPKNGQVKDTTNVITIDLNRQ